MGTYQPMLLRATGEVWWSLVSSCPTLGSVPNLRLLHPERLQPSVWTALHNGSLRPLVQGQKCLPGTSPPGHPEPLCGWPWGMQELLLPKILQEQMVTIQDTTSLLCRWIWRL